MLLVRPRLQPEEPGPGYNGDRLPFEAGKSCMLAAVPAELAVQLDEVCHPLA